MMNTIVEEGLVSFKELEQKIYNLLIFKLNATLPVALTLTGNVLHLL